MGIQFTNSTGGGKQSLPSVFTLMNHLTIYPNSSQPGKDASYLREVNSFFLQELWTNNYPQLVNYANNILQNNLYSEDIVQEAFTKFWLRKADFDHEAKIRSFLYITVKNACYDRLRSNSIHDRIHEEITYTSERFQDNKGDYDMMYAEYIKQVRTNLPLLPEKCRKVFKLYFFGNLSTSQIAIRLGIAEQTVRNQKSKAANLLMEVLSKTIRHH